MDPSYLAVGAATGVLEVAVTHPFDSFKISRQVNTPFRPFAGMGPRLVGLVPMRAVFWGTMWGVDVKDPVLRGALAGLAQTVVDTPVEVLKIRKQTGFHRPLFSGFVPHAARNLVFGACVSVSLPSWAIAGAVAGTTATHWLDVLKTSAQSGVSPVGWWRGWGARTTQACVAMGCGQFAMWLLHRRSQ